MNPLIPLGVALAALGTWLAWRLVHESKVRRAARAAFFDAVRSLFENIKVRIEPTGFARLSGRRNGLTFDLQAIPDTLTFRKLPALWVLVTVPEPMPVNATLDILARPSGNEPFTRFASLSHALPVPSALPEGVAVRSDNAAALPPESLWARHATLFNDPQIKELVISPKGLRIVFLAEEADRGRYLIFREAEMGMVPLAPNRLEPLLQRLAALRTDIISQSKEPA